MYFMTQLLQNAAYGTVLILAVVILRRVLKDRLLPGARLALWAVCLFRLLTPAAPESVFSLWGLSRLFEQPKQAAPVPYTAGYVPAPSVPDPAPPQAEPGISRETVLLAVWLVVGVLLAARYLLAWTRTRRAVACAIPLDRSDQRYTPLPRCARLREGPMEGAPLTFGAVRPTVVLSPGLDGAELDCVLAHEGVHARRRDNLWHYAMALALVVHWWNPAVWLMSRLLRRDIELSCDRAAVRRLGEDRRAEYAQALVSLATQADSPAFCHTFGRKAAEERILSIMKFKKTSVIGVIFSLTLVLAVTAAFASEPKDGSTRENALSAAAIANLPEDVLAYAEELSVGMPREDVHVLLGEPSFSCSNPYSDTYELDPDTDKRQLCIYYDIGDTVTQVKYFSDGTVLGATGIDLTPILSSSASASPMVPLLDKTKEIQSDFPEIDPDDVDLSEMKKMLDKKVADGQLTQAEADQRLADTEAVLEQARRGEMKLFWYDNGDGDGENWFYGVGVFQVNGEIQSRFVDPGQMLQPLYYEDENGKLVHVDPDTVVNGYVLVSDTPDTPSYVEEGEDISDMLGSLLGEADIKYDEGKTAQDYNVKLPTFDEDGNPVSADDGITGSRFYSYKVEVGSDAADSDIIDRRQMELDEYKALLDKLVAEAEAEITQAQADSIYASARQLLEQHGEMAGLYVSDDGSFVVASCRYPCTRADCANESSHYHDGVLYAGTLPICTLADCGNNSVHAHNGVRYKGWTGKLPAPVPSAAPSAAPAQSLTSTAPSTSCGVAGCTETRYHAHNEGRTILLSEPCPVEGCTITGNHIHGDVCYSCNGAGHDGGTCDGSCYTYNTVNTSTHHSESHHSGSHH